jgi:hypothetical protein
VFNGGFAANAGSTIAQSNNTSSLIGARFNASNRKIGFNANNSNGQGFIASNSNSVSGSANQTYDIDGVASRIDFTDSVHIDVAASGSAGGTITYVDVADFATTGSVFNQGNANIDFRVASLNTASALFLDGATGVLGLNTNAPAPWVGARAVQLGASGFVFGDGQIANWVAGIALNEYRSSNTWKISSASSPTGKFEIGNGATGASSGFGFYYGAAGTAGATVGDVYLMQLTSSGDLILKQGEFQTATAGTSNFRAGVNAGNSIASGGNYNVCVGDEAGTAISTGDLHTFIGYGAGDDVSTEATGLTAVGAHALASNTSGTDNLAIGVRALSDCTEGIGNIAVGRYAAADLVDADGNVAIGAYDGTVQPAMRYNTKSHDNVAIGSGALAAHNLTDNSSGYNTAVGYSAGVGITDGIKNTIVGGIAGRSTTTGGFNTFIGYNVGDNNVGGSNNVIVGVGSNPAATGENQAVGLGPNLTCAADFTTVGSGTDDIRAAHGTATWAAVSDERYKKDIAHSTTGLSFINALQPRTFKYKTLGELPETFNAYEADSTKVFKNSNTNHGFIAQEVKAAIDADSSIKDGFKLWGERPDGGQEIAEAALIPILVKAIQEQNALIEALTARVATLEG